MPWDVHAPECTGRAPEVRASYHRTELGMIPEDWGIEAISTIANVKTGPFGSALHERDYVDDGTPIVTVEHLSEHGIRHQNLPLVSDRDRLRLKSYLLRPGDIVFSRVGSVDRNALVSHDEDGWLFSGRLLRVRISSEDLTSARYLSYHLHTESFKKRVHSLAVGQTMASLNTQILRAVQVVLPPLLEQHAIAAVLSDADELIRSLEALIAKKQDTKQAAIQQLLTGRTRLPGFGGEWPEGRLGDIAQLHREHVVPDPASDAPYMHFSLPAYDAGQRPAMEPSSAIRSGKFRVPNDAILVSRLNPRIARVWAPTCGGSNAIASTEFLVLTPRTSVNRMFLYSLCSSPQFWEGMLLVVTGTTGSHQRVNRDDAMKLPVRFPEDPSEQRAIATVLSDMDAEIAALEHRLDKTRAIKQGMMQQLLTGSIRLPIPDDDREDDDHDA